MSDLRLSDFDYAHPPGLTADSPASPRDSSRLMVLRGRDGPTHQTFRDLPLVLEPGDCLVLNRSRVLPFRLLGHKATGGRADLLLVRSLGPGLWRVLGRGLKPGHKIRLDGDASARVVERDAEGLVCRFEPEDVLGFALRHGLAPLPPYILRRRGNGHSPVPRETELARYQTVYASEDGSIAAPTAGLHFTPTLIDALSRRGVVLSWLVLHVGPGTFRPIVHDDPREHRMLPEWYRLEAPDADTILEARSRGRRVIAVGTTATRALESLAARPQGLGPGEGETDLFIWPGHRFAAVTGLLTNFHLPRSTPLMLAAAFAGRPRLLAAYREAVARRYRLFSYGDSMLILP